VDLSVDTGRLRADLEGNAAFGRIPSDDPEERGRTNRTGTEANRASRDRLVERFEDAGLDVAVDAVGTVGSLSASPNATNVVPGRVEAGVDVRDVVVGANRSLDGLRATINAAVGLEQGHLWFVGRDEDYWNSDVKYQCPQEFEDSQSGPAMGFGEETHDAGEATVGDVVDRLALDERDRLCYLYDYGDEWRFYAILKEIVDNDPAERRPEVVESKGGTVDQTCRDGDGRR